MIVILLDSSVNSVIPIPEHNVSNNIYPAIFYIPYLRRILASKAVKIRQCLSKIMEYNALRSLLHRDVFYNLLHLRD
jgi:hypothetical protein